MTQFPFGCLGIASLVGIGLSIREVKAMVNPVNLEKYCVWRKWRSREVLSSELEEVK